MFVREMPRLSFSVDVFPRELTRYPREHTSVHGGGTGVRGGDNCVRAGMNSVRVGGSEDDAPNGERPIERTGAVEGRGVVVRRLARRADKGRRAGLKKSERSETRLRASRPPASRCVLRLVR